MSRLDVVDDDLQALGLRLGLQKADHALHQQRRVRVVEREPGAARGHAELVVVLREQGELRPLRPGRHRAEGEQVHPEARELREDAVRGAGLVAHGRVEVVDAADGEGHRGPPHQSRGGLLSQVQDAPSTSRSRGASAATSGASASASSSSSATSTSPSAISCSP